MSIHLSGTIGVLKKALINFANENKELIVRPSEVKIIIGISDVTVTDPTEKNPVKRTEGHPYYRVIKKDKPYLRARKIKVYPYQAMTDEVSFLQVLDAKLDFFQVEELSKPYLIDAFGRFTEEVNEITLNNPGFIEYVNNSIPLEKDEKPLSEEDKEHVKNLIIAENMLKPSDLEIMIVTPRRNEIQGIAIDEPVEPVPFLYAKGECIRQIDFAKDIFQIFD
jgi:hypothetical protein